MVAAMRDRDLYAKILGIQQPGSVSDVQLDMNGEEVRVSLACEASASLCCPECGKDAPRYDARARSWRHLDTCQFRTILTADVPRVTCSKHGVRQVRVSWAEPGSGFTALLERLIIDWLLEASIAAVSRQVDLTWDAVDGIMRRAVRRGLQRRSVEAPRRIGVDETSFQKRHEYVSVVCDLDRSRVLHVADGRGKESLDQFYRQLPPQQLARIEQVAMDMWEPFINSTREHVPEAEDKIAFDKFHVAKHLGDAVNDVRKAEHRALMAKGDNRLLRTKYLWLRNPGNMSSRRWADFATLRKSSLKVARAWALKETAMSLWDYISHPWANKAWRKWIGAAMRSRLDPMKKVARMVRSHLQGILTAVTWRVTNATAESINSKIQWIKRMACGFRNRLRFRNAIYFHLGGLDLYPRL